MCCMRRSGQTLPCILALGTESAGGKEGEWVVCVEVVLVVRECALGEATWRDFACRVGVEHVAGRELSVGLDAKTILCPPRRRLLLLGRIVGWESNLNMKINININININRGNTRHPISITTTRSTAALSVRLNRLSPVHDGPQIASGHRPLTHPLTPTHHHPSLPSFQLVTPYYYCTYACRLPN
jgi:hypothetical protein